MKKILRFIAPAFAMLALSSLAAQWQQYPVVSAPGLSDTFLIGTSTTNQQISAANYATWVLNRNTSGVMFINSFSPGMQLIVVGTNSNGQMIVVATNMPTGGDMLRAQNLADVANAATARDNIGADNASNLTLGTLPQTRLPDVVETNAGPITSGLLLKSLGGSFVGGATPGTDFLAPSGSGASLTALNASQLTSGTVPQTRLPSTVLTNFTGSLSAGLLKKGSGTSEATNATPDVDYLTPSGSGASLTALNASQLTSGTVPQGRLPSDVVTNNGAFSAGLMKKGAGANELTNATPGVDYLTPAAGGFASITNLFLGTNEVNVKSFGAKGDSVTDDTAAFQAAINSITNTGGIIDIPDGIYLINGAFSIPQGSPDRTNRCQIYLPARDLQTQPILSFWFRGTQHPAINTIWNTGVTPAASTNGAIIVSTNIPTNPLFSIFGAGAPSGSPYTMSAINTIFERLTIRTYDNPKTTALNLSKIAQCEIKDCVIDTGTGGGNQSEPTRLGCGVILPEINNWVISRMNNVDIRGYWVGTIMSEHTYIDDVRAWMCEYAWQLPGGTHGMFVGKTTTTGCKYGIIGGPAGGWEQRVFWSDYEVEHSILGTGAAGDTTWANSVYDIADTNSVVFGQINYSTVQSGVGANSDFKIMPGTSTNVSLYDMYSHAYNRLSIRAATTNDTDETMVLTFTDPAKKDNFVGGIGQYLQPFQYLTAIFLGDRNKATLTPVDLATNFNILGSSNTTTINAGQPVANAIISFQVGHQGKMGISNTNITATIPFNFTNIFRTNLTVNTWWTNNSDGPAVVKAAGQFITGASGGSATCSMWDMLGNTIVANSATTVANPNGNYVQIVGYVAPRGGIVFSNTSSGSLNVFNLFSADVFRY